MSSIIGRVRETEPDLWKGGEFHGDKLTLLPPLPLPPAFLMRKKIKPHPCVGCGCREDVRAMPFSEDHPYQSTGRSTGANPTEHQLSMMCCIFVNALQIWVNKQKS